MDGQLTMTNLRLVWFLDESYRKTFAWAATALSVSACMLSTRVLPVLVYTLKGYVQTQDYV